MSRYSRRVVAMAAVGAFAVAPMVTACAAGKSPQSALPTQLAEGVNASAGPVQIRNAFVLGAGPGQSLTKDNSAPLYAWFVNNGASPDRLVAVDAAPGIAESARIAGGGIDLPPGRLVGTTGGPQPTATPTVPGGVSTPGTGAPTRRPLSTPAPGTSETAAAPGTSETPAPGASAGVAPPPAAPTPAAPPTSKIILSDLQKDLVNGDNLRLTLHFQSAGVVTVSVPVVSRQGLYNTFGPVAAVPATVASPSPQAVRHARPGSSKTGRTTRTGTAKRHKKTATPTT